MKMRVLAGVLLIGSYTWATNAGENVSRLAEALRTAKTATVRVEKFTVDGKDFDGKQILSGCLNYLLGQMQVHQVATNADLVFILDVEAGMRAAEYGSAASSIKVATGSEIRGTIRVETKEGIVETIALEGSRGPTSTFVLRGVSENPFAAALSSSGLHARLLSAFVETRGLKVLDPIIKEYKMVTAATNLDGGLSAYKAVFAVLSASSDPQAERLLTTLAQDPDSDSAKTLAKEALRVKAEKKSPNQSVDGTR